jgi:mycothiol synthase
MSIDKLSLRPYLGHADNALLAPLAENTTGESYSPERVAYDLTAPGINQTRDIAVCQHPDGHIAGYARVQIEDVGGIRQGRFNSHVPPDSEVWGGASRDLLLWAARRMQEEIDTTGKPATIIERVDEENLRRREFLEDAGFRTVRYFRIMRLDEACGLAEIDLPGGHSYVHGPGREGAEKYVAMFNETWIDHYGFTPLTKEDFLHDIESDPDYNPSLDIVIEGPDARYVGFAFCRIEPQHPVLGEVMAIGIRRGSRGTGLGRMLLTHAIRSLIERGATRIELGVDSENPTGAERLYESVGFKVVSMRRRCQLDQDSIIRLATLNPPQAG